jgi:Tol biopolymer transport system component
MGVRMSEFKEGTVKVRGVEYTVREWSNKTRREFVRKVSGDGADTVNAFLAHRCSYLNGKPAFATEEEADEKAPEVIDAIAQAVLSVSGAEGNDSKND